MKERPILMTGTSVCGILEERKTQTRRLKGLEKLNSGYYKERISKVECRDGLWCFWEVGHGSSALPVFTAKCHYGVPGDHLWVKETHAWLDRQVDGTERESPVVVGFRADDSVYRFEPEANRISIDHLSDYGNFKLRPSIFMPRWASRITLELTAVRVERLQEITEEDAKAEGCKGGHDSIPGYSFSATPKEEYRYVWSNINGTKDGLSTWAQNPWVWVLEFKRISP